MSNDNRYSDSMNEYFDFVLNVDNSCISSKELRAYLLQLERLIDSINHTLRHSEFAGFESISIDVIALERGSFKIPLIIKKKIKPENFNILKEITDNSTVGTIIGGIIVSLFVSGSSIRDELITTDPHWIPEKVYLDNIDSARAVKSIAKLAIDNDSIHDLSITYESREGKKTIKISKESLIETKHYMDYIIDNRDEPFFLHKETVKIISPNFSDDPKISWKFMFNERIIEAEMHDHYYLHRVKSGEIDFHYGDVITVDMMFEGSGKNRKYYILHVLDY